MKPTRILTLLCCCLAAPVPAVAQYQVNVDRIPVAATLGPSWLNGTGALAEDHDIGFNLGIFGAIPVAGPLAVRWTGGFERYYYKGAESKLGGTQQLNLWNFGGGLQLQSHGRTQVYAFAVGAMFIPTLGNDDDPDVMEVSKEFGWSFGGGLHHHLSSYFSVGVEMRANRTDLGGGEVLWAVSPSVYVARLF